MSTASALWIPTLVLSPMITTNGHIHGSDADGYRRRGRSIEKRERGGGVVGYTVIFSLWLGSLLLLLSSDRLALVPSGYCRFRPVPHALEKERKILTFRKK